MVDLRLGDCLELMKDIPVFMYMEAYHVQILQSR